MAYFCAAAAPPPSVAQMALQPGLITQKPVAALVPRAAERRNSRCGPTASKVSTSTSASVAQAVKRDPTKEELVAAVASLYDDQLRPYGRIVKKRLEEFAEAAGGEVPSTELATLQRLCSTCDELAVSMEGESDWSIEIVARARDFIDIYSSEDAFSEAFWQEATAYFGGLADTEMTKPGGRYESAQNLLALQLPFLAGFTLGKVCHFVQLAMAQKKLLGYHKGAIVPYRRSQTFLKEQCAEQQKLVKVSKMPLASWEALHVALLQLFLEQRVIGGVDALPLSNIKRYLRTSSKMDLSETGLGHSSLCDLFKDERLGDVCSVRLRENGYYIHPVEAAVDEYEAANPSLRLEAQIRQQQQQQQYDGSQSPQRRRCSEPVALPSQGACITSMNVSVFEHLSCQAYPDPRMYLPLQALGAQPLSCLASPPPSPSKKTSPAAAGDRTAGFHMGSSGMTTSSAWDVMCSALGMGAVGPASAVLGDASTRALPAANTTSAPAAAAPQGDASERGPPGPTVFTGDASERVPMLPPAVFHPYAAAPLAAALPASAQPPVPPTLSQGHAWQQASPVFSLPGSSPAGALEPTTPFAAEDGELSESEAGHSSKGSALASTDVGSSCSAQDMEDSLPGTPRFVAAMPTPSPFEVKSFDIAAYLAVAEEEEENAEMKATTQMLPTLADKGYAFFVHNTFIEVEETPLQEALGGGSLRRRRRASSVPRSFQIRAPCVTA